MPLGSRLGTVQLVSTARTQVSLSFYQQQKKKKESCCPSLGFKIKEKYGKSSLQIYKKVQSHGLRAVMANL